MEDSLCPQCTYQITGSFLAERKHVGPSKTQLTPNVQLFQLLCAVSILKINIEISKIKATEVQQNPHVKLKPIMCFTRVH